MAKILTFQAKAGPGAGQDFLTGEENTLSFDLSDDGDVSLGDLSHASLSGLFPDPKKDWTNQELADLFRVRHLLSVANVPVTTDRGVSDEGDPWFVFCRANGEVFIHLCRIDGQYVLDSPTVLRPLRGADFGALIADFTQNAVPSADGESSAPGRVIKLERGGNVRLHPSAMLAALIWSLFLALEDLVLLAPEGDLADDDDLLDFDRVFGQDTPEEIDLDPLFMEAPVTGNGDPLEAADTRGAVDVPDAGGQLRDVASQHGLTLNSNAFAMGLSTIAIAMGFMSEAVLLDNQRKFMETMASLGLWDGSADNRAAHDLDEAAGSGENSALLALLGDFLGLEPSLHDDAPELAEGSSERSAEDHTGTSLSAMVQDLEPGAAATGKPVPDGSQKADAPAEDVADDAARDTSGSIPPAVLSANGDAVLGEAAGLDIAPVTLLEVVQTWQPQMEVVQFGQTMILASFDLTDGTASMLASLIDTADERKSQHVYEADLTAQRLITFLEAKEGEIGFIEFKDEIIMVDRTAVTGGDTDFIQWEASDGRTISFIGLAADLQAFDMIA